MKEKILYTDYLKSLKACMRLSVITSVTRCCILKCGYCYARKLSNALYVLPDYLLKKIIHDSFRTRHEEVVFEWTGGEPLFASQRFFKQVISYQRIFQVNKKEYSNVVQTSGAMYDTNFYDFLIDNGFRLSLTIDGPSNIHNEQRPLYDSEKDSLYTVCKSYEYINKKQGNCGVLCTITKNSLGHEQEIINFYKNIGIQQWYSNPYLYDPKKPIKENALALNPSDYAEYFKKQFDYWLSLDDSTIMPKVVNSILSNLCGIKNTLKCSNSGICLTNFINFDDEGNATICPKFLGYPQYSLGNIAKNNIYSMLSSKNNIMDKFLKGRFEALRNCKERCDYFSICNGGCLYRSLIKDKSANGSERDYLCEGKRDLFNYIDQAAKKYGLNTLTS